MLVVQATKQPPASGDTSFVWQAHQGDAEALLLPFGVDSWSAPLPFRKEIVYAEGVERPL